MLLEDVELNVSKKIASFIEEKFGGKNPMLSDLWIDIENFVEEKISPEYEAEIENPEIEGLESTIEELESEKDDLSESISELSEAASANADSTADYLEKEILPRIEGKWQDYTGDDAKALKEKIAELRGEADNFRNWSF